MRDIIYHNKITTKIILHPIWRINEVNEKMFTKIIVYI